ncbi:MAG: NAD(P)(+) transhydrogenase (Re/Si-specific) subunit beta [Flavobacteriales bacterium]|nr:NAD(P)(+) transhydrogenase (Re/Si-specific) subunit beta [Flavobacteriales bacterium]
MTGYYLEITYVIAVVLFMMGLKKLGHPETARKGNMQAGIGMGIAIVATLLLYKNGDGSGIGNYEWIAGGILIGCIIGLLTAKKVAMTAMPQMVSLFNGMGGACSAFIGLIEFGPAMNGEVLTYTTVLACLVVGTLTFSGSMIAFAKLNGNLNKDIRLPYYNILNTLIMITLVGLTACLLMHQITDARMWIYILFGLSLVYGILFVIPIGGADMPVVISLLNSLSGIAAALAGFIYGNNVMIIGGILVGASGTILTIAMCEGMNRPLSNVIFGAFGAGGASGGATGADGASKTVKEASASDVAVMMNYSQSVVMVPGYGLAVAQAQHIMAEFQQMLETNGVEVKYAIHPVAGRMPGHMNVLLAEANVEYDKLVEMDDINPKFPTTDVVLIVGANDVVNPAANTDPQSPIYGMPILEVEQASKIIIVKRSMNTGYAGIENELFFNDKTSMLFGDAKKVITDLVGELKNM